MTKIEKHLLLSYKTNTWFYDIKQMKGKDKPI